MDDDFEYVDTNQAEDGESSYNESEDEDDRKRGNDFDEDDLNQEDLDKDEAVVEVEEDDVDKHPELFLSPARIATTTCLHQYAILRFRGAENNLYQWPPIMLDVIRYLNNDYPRGKLNNEINVAMVELMLKVPIWLCMPYDMNGQQMKLRLTDPGVLDFSGQSFVEAIEIVKDLLEASKLQDTDLRRSALYHIRGRQVENKDDLIDTDDDDD